ncbi:hypothetical protein WJX79_009482 [Trebouxia sp. C0005]
MDRPASRSGPLDCDQVPASLQTAPSSQQHIVCTPQSAQLVPAQSYFFRDTEASGVVSSHFVGIAGQWDATFGPTITSMVDRQRGRTSPVVPMPNRPYKALVRGISLKQAHEL